MNARPKWLTVAVGMVLRFTVPDLAERSQYLVSRSLLLSSPGGSATWFERVNDLSTIPGTWKPTRLPSLSIPWRVRARTYSKNTGIQSRKTLFMCPDGCEAARLATYLHHLPWQRFVTLTTPPGQFRSAVSAWAGLDILNVFGDGKRPSFVQPFWTAVIASHDDPRKFDLRTANLHMHILLGGCDKSLLDDILTRWPWVIPRDGNKPVDRRVWSVLHYLYAQIKGNRFERLRHQYEVFEMPMFDGYNGYVLTGYSPLVISPLYSKNLDAIQAHFARGIRAQRRRIRSEAARKGRGKP